jgi:hypothetical protein
MPSQTAGALVGTAWKHSDGHTVIEVTDAVSIGLTPSERGLVPDKNQWDNLKNWLASTYKEPARIVGWYYTYPDIELPGGDLDDVEQFMFVPHLELLLLVSPADNQGAFYTWENNRFVPTGGFYEVKADKHALPVVPWDGQLSGLGDELLPDVGQGERPVQSSAGWPAQPVQEGVPTSVVPEEQSAVEQDTILAAQLNLLDSAIPRDVEDNAPPALGDLDQLHSELADGPIAPPMPDATTEPGLPAIPPPPPAVALAPPPETEVWSSPPRPSRARTAIMIVLGIILLAALTFVLLQRTRTVATPSGSSTLPSNSTGAITVKSLEVSAKATAQAIQAVKSKPEPSATSMPATATPSPEPPAGTVVTTGALTNTLTLEDSDFTGGTLTKDFRYRGRSARLAYGSGTGHNTLEGRFNLNLSVFKRVENVDLVVVALNSSGAKNLPLRLTLNDVELQNGPSPFPTDLGELISGPGNWGSYVWRVDAASLKQGANVLQIANLDPGADESTGPFFVLDKAEIQYRGQAR